MFDTTMLLKGLLIGFTIALAVGPIAILCIQHSLSRGFKAGFSIGLGAAIADSTYGAIAGAGFASFSHALLNLEDLIALFGSIYLFWLGFKTYKTRTLLSCNKKEIKPHSFFRSLVSSFLLTLSSPMTILMFAAIFGSVGLAANNTTYSIVFGVFIGSTCWWLILSSSMGAIRGKIPDYALSYMNHLSALMLTTFACYAFLRASIHLITSHSIII
jgi:putative LysE/RhtB family amino acid efflux pump